MNMPYPPGVAVQQQSNQPTQYAPQQGVPMQTTQGFGQMGMPMQQPMQQQIPQQQMQPQMQQPMQGAMGYPMQQMQQPMQQMPPQMQQQMAVGMQQGQTEDPHAFDDQINLSGASVWDPVIQALPTGVYEIECLSMTKKPGKDKPDARNYWWDVKVIGGKHDGVTCSVIIPCQPGESWVANKLYTAALSFGYTPQQAGAPTFRINEATFKGRRGFLHVKAVDKDTEIPQQPQTMAFDPTQPVGKKRKPMDDRNFITREIYQRELATMEMLGRTNGQAQTAHAPQVQQQPVAQVQQQAFQAPMAGVAPQPMGQMGAMGGSLAGLA